MTRKLQAMLGKTATVATIASGKMFPGQYYDSETGLHQNGFRTYDPNTGRYLEADPIGQLGGINLYTYSLNNPIRFTDPEGLNPAAGALAGGAVAGPPGALVGGAIGLGIGILIGDAMFNDDGSDSTDAPDDDGAEQCDDDNDDNCEALYQSTLRTCASLKGMKQFRCYEAARINRDQCYQERKR
jgi:RHS repeat-associated protein